MKRTSFTFVVMLALFATPTSADERPRLIVFLSIDQMRADHLQRYAKEYSGGFKRLVDEGVYYSHADLNYANTSTAPGHATLSTGVYPWKSGIVGNNYIDRATGKRTYSVEDSAVTKVDGEGGARSPRNLLATTVGDWLKAVSPASKVVSISYKDRAAVLMGGHKANEAFWYDRSSGHMVTSSYYMSTLPPWAKTFNGGEWTKRNLPGVWMKMKEDAVYSKYGPDELQGEGIWDGSTAFPHKVNEKRIFSQLFGTPWGNTYLLDFARSALVGEKLGERGVTDLLCVSLSTTDNIGSEFGPNSHEMLDNLLRLDQDLELFLGDLEKSLGKGNVLFLLAGDHGVMQLPEYLASVEHVAARRFNNRHEVEQKLRTLDSLMRIEYGVNEWIVSGSLIHYALLEKSGIRIPLIEERIRAELKKVDGIEDVVFRTEIQNDRAPQRPYLDAFRRSFRSERSPDFFIRDCEHCLVTDATTGSAHGSPYMHDRLVPIIFWGSGAPAQKVDRRVHTVDIAATLAAMFALPAPQDLDGVPLNEVTQTSR